MMLRFLQMKRYEGPAKKRPSLRVAELAALLTRRPAAVDVLNLGGEEKKKTRRVTVSLLFFR